MRKILSLLLISLSVSAFAVNSTASATATASPTTNKTTNATVMVKITPCEAGSPCAAVRDTTQQVMDVINNPSIQDKAVDRVKAIAIPQFDFHLMTKYALGNNWKLATPKQQEQLVDLFQTLLIYTYSSAISKFKNAKFTLVSAATKDIGSGTNTDKSTAIVISQVLLNNNGANAQPVKVEYDLVHYNNKPWMAYDIKIEDASLVTTYRNQFNDVITSSKIDGLIKQLKSKIDSLSKGS